MKQSGPQRARQSTRKKIKKSLGPDFLDPSNLGLHGKETQADIRCDICHECLPVNSKKDCVSCRRCPIQAHANCIRAQLNVKYIKSLWLCLACRHCYECDSSGIDQSELVFCRTCDASFHYDCSRQTAEPCGSSYRWTCGQCKKPQLAVTRYHGNRNHRVTPKITNSSSDEKLSETMTSSPSNVPASPPTPSTSRVLVRVRGKRPFYVEVKKEKQPQQQQKQQKIIDHDMDQDDEEDYDVTLSDMGNDDGDEPEDIDDDDDEEYVEKRKIESSSSSTVDRQLQFDKKETESKDCDREIDLEKIKEKESDKIIDTPSSSSEEKRTFLLEDKNDLIRSINILKANGSARGTSLLANTSSNAITCIEEEETRSNSGKASSTEKSDDIGGPAIETSQSGELTEETTQLLKDSNGSKRLKLVLFERACKAESLLPTETSLWTVEDVSNFIRFIGFPDAANNFLDHQIDGKSLLLLSRRDVLTGFKLKLGPALKIYAHIFRLQRKRPALLLED